MHRPQRTPARPTPYSGLWAAANPVVSEDAIRGVQVPTTATNPGAFQLPVLMYHRIGPVRRDSKVPGHYVPKPLFRAQMAWLKMLRFETVTMSQVHRALIGQGRLPRRPIAITFDDAFECVHTQAFPVLRANGFSATVFAVAEHVGGANTWDEMLGDVTERLMSADQLRQAARHGIEIGSHTLTHPHLTELPVQEAKREVVESKRVLESILSQPVHSFCYPYGNHDEVAKQLVREAGYLTACATTKGIVEPGSDPMALPRINVRRDTWTPVFLMKLVRAYRQAVEA